MLEKVFPVLPRQETNCNSAKSGAAFKKVGVGMQIRESKAHIKAQRGLSARLYFLVFFIPDLHEIRCDVLHSAMPPKMAQQKRYMDERRIFRFRCLYKHPRHDYLVQYTQHGHARGQTLYYDLHTYKQEQV